MSNISDKDTVRWFAMNAYAHSIVRAEKALNGPDGLAYFIPKHYVLRNYSGKLRRELVPLIPDMLFIHASYNQIHTFRTLYPFVGFVRTIKDGNPTTLTIKDKDMEDFIKIASRYEEDLTYFRPEEVNLKKGERIRIIGGTFEGAEGTFVKVKGKRSRRLVVCLDGLLTVAASEISAEFIQRI